MTDAMARYATRQAVIENILADETIDSLGMSIVGALEAEEALTLRIGQLMVDSKDADAHDLRDCLYRTQTLREVCERLLEEARSIAASSP